MIESLRFLDKGTFVRIGGSVDLFVCLSVILRSQTLFIHNQIQGDTHYTSTQSYRMGNEALRRRILGLSNPFTRGRGSDSILTSLLLSIFSGSFSSGHFYESRIPV
jgi:hypothetical protein